MAQIDDLQNQLDGISAQVEKNTEVDQSAVVLLQQLKTAVDQIPSAPDLSTAIAMAQAISDKLGTDNQVLADAVVANTPAANP